MSANIQLIAEPDAFLQGIKCPYCKKESLGLLALQVGNGDKTMYQMQCLNVNCVTNHMAASASEMSVLVKRALGIPLPQ